MSGNIVAYQHRPLPPWINRVGMGLCAAGLLWISLAFLHDPARASFDYLIMLAFLASLAAGSLFLLAIEYVTGAHWSVPYRRIPEFFSALVIPLSVLALPLSFFMQDLFHWAQQGAVNADPILQGKAFYLNPVFFAARMAFVFGNWLLFFLLFSRNSQRQDENGNTAWTSRNARLSPVFLLVFAITLTMLAVDWIMSLEPHWHSAVIGVYYFCGTVLAALSLLTFSAVRLQESAYLHPLLNRESYASLGTLIFAFTLLWAYIAFSQYLLIWYANLPEETFWYMDRTTGEWAPFALGLVMLHFVIPFLILLPRSAKTSPLVLTISSICMLFAHYLDLYWLVMPSFSRAGNAVFSFIDLGFPLLPTGLAICVLAIQSRRRCLVPVRDPALERGLRFHR